MGDIVYLFGREALEKPEEHPVAKSFVSSFRSGTDPLSYSSENGMIYVTWESGDHTIILTADPDTSQGNIEVFRGDEDVEVVLHAKLTTETDNRWVGVYIDDRWSTKY